jgi:hypothetical protein
MNMIEAGITNPGYDIVDLEVTEPTPVPEEFTDTLVKLSEDDQQALAKELGEQMGKAYDAGSGYRDDILDWRAQYEGDLENKPEKWQANYNIPHISSVIDTVSDQLSGLICSGIPFFSCEPNDPADDIEANTMEQMMEYWLRRMHFNASVRLGIHDTLLSGTNWIISWAERNPNPSENYSDTATVENIEAYPFKEWVSPEDIILIPFHAQSFLRAKGGFVRNIKRWSEILAAEEDKRFYKEGVEQVKANWSQTRAQTYAQQAQGVEVVEPTDLWTAEFETWWGIYRWVKPGDKQEREYMIDVAWSPEQRKAVVLRAVEYDSNKFGGWPFTVIANRPRKDSMWGRSSVKPISGMQKWYNATFDQMTDAITLTIMPPLAIRPGAGRRKYTWGPQAMNQVSNPATDIVSMGPANTSLAGIGAALNMTGFVQGMSDRQTGTSEPTMGVPTQERRTAFEMGLVAQGGNVRFESQVAYLEIGAGEDSGLETFAYKLAAVLGAFMPRMPFKFPAPTATQGMMTAEPKVYDLKYRFTLRANSALSSPDMRLKKAMASIQQIQQCPLTNPSVLDSPERLIEKMRAIWQSYREVWQIMGNKNPEEVIGAEPQTIEEALAVAAAIPGAMPVAQVLAVRFGVIHPPSGAVDEKGQPIPSPQLPTETQGGGNPAGLGNAGEGGIPGGTPPF